MIDDILVLNAGSSSIKFCVFAATPSGLDLVLRGQAEGLFTSPRFVAKTADGALIGENPGAKTSSSATTALSNTCASS